MVFYLQQLNFNFKINRPYTRKTNFSVRYLLYIFKFFQSFEWKWKNEDFFDILMIYIRPRQHFIVLKNFYSDFISTKNQLKCINIDCCLIRTPLEYRTPLELTFFLNILAIESRLQAPPTSRMDLNV